MLHKKVLVMTLIIGVSMHMMKVITSAVEIEEEAEQQVKIVQSEVSIPVQGYIIPVEEEIKEPIIPEQPNEAKPVVKVVREIVKTTDIIAYHVYVMMLVISLLWIVFLWTHKKESKARYIW